MRHLPVGSPCVRNPGACQRNGSKHQGKLSGWNESSRHGFPPLLRIRVIAIIRDRAPLVIHQHQVTIESHAPCPLVILRHLRVKRIVTRIDISVNLDPHIYLGVGPDKKTTPAIELPQVGSRAVACIDHLGTREGTARRTFVLIAQKPPALPWRTLAIGLQGKFRLVRS